MWAEGLADTLGSLSQPLTEHSGDGAHVCAMLQELLGAPQPPAVSRTTAILELCWERLHVGEWSRIDPAWRVAYALCALVRAHALRACGDFALAVRHVDLALLMGHGQLHPLAHRVLRTTPRPQLVLPPWPARPMLPIPEAFLRFPCVAETNVRPPLVPLREPLVIRGLASAFPACTRWCDAAYLAQVLGHRVVPVELGSSYVEERWAQRLMPFQEFYNDYLVSDTRHERPCGYLAQTALLQQVPELLADVLEPDYCALTSSNDAGPTTMNAWLGPEGTVSPLHTDPRHNVFCQIAGSKVVLLFPAAAPGLYPFTVGLTTNTSQVDAERPNMDSFPMYAHAPGSVAVLHAGDALFIPRGVWHYVKALQPSWSVSFWFD